MNHTAMLELIESQLQSLECQAEAIRHQVSVLREALASQPETTAAAPQRAHRATEAHKIQSDRPEQPTQTDLAKKLIKAIWIDGSCETDESLDFKQAIREGVAAGIAEGTARRYFSELSKEGLIEKDQDAAECGQNLWQLTKAGKRYHESVSRGGITV